MRSTSIALLSIVLFHIANCKIDSVDKRGAMDKMKMTDKKYKKVVKMHESWYAQSVHSLIGAMSRKLIKDNKDDAELRKAFIVCLDEVEEEDAVKQSAQCLSHAFDGSLVSSYRKKMRQDRYSFIDNTIVVTDANKDFLQRSHSTNEVSTAVKESYSTSFVTEKRKKRRKGLKKLHRRKKNSHHKQHREEMDGFSKRPKRSIMDLFDLVPEKRKVKRVGAMPSLLSSDGSELVKTARMVKNILKIAKDKPIENTPLEFTMGRIEKLRAAQAEEKTEKGYRRRMLDSVLGKEHPLKDAIQKKKTVSGELKKLLPKELKPLSDILKQMPGIEKEGRDRVLSPRFLPLFPNEQTRDHNGFLSPEIMPLYRVPALLNATGMKSRDRNSLLSLILETSGTVDIIEEAITTVGKARDFGLGEDLNEITALMTKTFNEFKGMFNEDQHKEFKEKDFTMATGTQLRKLYGSEGMFNVSEFPFDIDEYDGWSADQKEESLKNTIRLLADDDPGALVKRRYKRDIVFPNGYKITFFRHTTLSPYAFSPTIDTLAVLGPAVLSPSLFSPNIMSPLLLSPPVISPQVGNPLIFSPYVLGPNVMSAAVFNAYIFSPYVLSPNVINPYVLSPLILSPFVLCPDVLSPTVLSGAILSPSVLSPAIYTKNVMSVSVLSPSFLS